MGRAIRGLALALAVVTAVASLPAGADAQTASDLAREIAPSGRLKAAMNLGNPILAREEAGELRGIAIDLARELGRRLGLPVDFVTYDGAGRVSDAARTAAWDVAFLAVDPGRAADIAFTAPYILIEGTYLVPEGSRLRRIEDVDAPGIRIAVGRGSAYDLHLSRALTRAEIVRAPTSLSAIDLFLDEKLDVLAGVRQPLVLYAREHPGFRVMDGRFMAIGQAMGVPRGRDGAAAYVTRFVEDAKASGFLLDAIRRSDQPDAAIAPPGP